MLDRLKKELASLDLVDLEGIVHFAQEILIRPDVELTAMNLGYSLSKEEVDQVIKEYLDFKNDPQRENEYIVEFIEK